VDVFQVRAQTRPQKYYHKARRVSLS